MKSSQRPKIICAWVITATIFISALMLWYRLEYSNTTNETPMALNAYGDYIAGVMASCGLVWIVTGVLIQSDELATSVREFEKTAQALLDQAKLQREQFEYSKDSDVDRSPPIFTFSNTSISSTPSTLATTNFGGLVDSRRNTKEITVVATMKNEGGRAEAMDIRCLTLDMQASISKLSLSPSESCQISVVRNCEIDDDGNPSFNLGEDIVFCELASRDLAGLVWHDDIRLEESTSAVSARRLVSSSLDSFRGHSKVDQLVSALKEAFEDMSRYR